MLKGISSSIAEALHHQLSLGSTTGNDTTRSGLKNPPDSGVRVRVYKDQAFYDANPEKAKERLIKYLVEKGIALGVYASHLHIAAFLGKKNHAAYLLEKGADPLHENFKGFSPIDIARLAKRTAIEKLLEEHMKKSRPDD